MTKQIFPVVSDHVATYMEFDQLHAAKESDEWFIADRSHLQKCFVGLVPLLAIRPADIPRMTHLLETLGLRDRLLSRIASAVVQTSAEVEVSEEATRMMRRKARFICR